VKITADKRMIRAGSAPKTICYSQAMTKRGFDFQDDLKSRVNVETLGKIDKKVVKKSFNAESNEDAYSALRKKKLFSLPDTKRCFIPELNVEPEKLDKRLFENRLRDYQVPPGNFSSLIGRTGNEQNITNCRKQTNPNNWRSNILTEEMEHVGERQRSLNKRCQFKIYDTTTQIVALPGGVKRAPSMDEGRKKMNNSYTMKIMNDYKSKISCLPGTIKKQEIVETLHKKFMVKGRNERAETMYNSYANPKTNVTVPDNYTQYSTLARKEDVVHRTSLTLFNVCNRRKDNDKKVFGESIDEKRFVTQIKSKRPIYIRNPFESQITIT